MIETNPLKHYFNALIKNSGIMVKEQHDNLLVILPYCTLLLKAYLCTCII